MGLVAEKLGHTGGVRDSIEFVAGNFTALGYLVVGIFAWLQKPIDGVFVAALLTIVGLSVNDTVVVFDRIRENFRKIRRGTPLDIMNLSINETLSRTILTSVATALVALPAEFVTTTV